MAETKFTNKDLQGFILLAALAAFLGSIGVLAYQVFEYLKLGYWDSMSVLYPFYDSWDWAYYPDSWFGLHDLLEKIPLSLGLFFGSIGLATIGFQIET